MQITTWQADAAGAPLQRSSAELLPPGPGEALLEVLHCGLCHSDLSMLDNHWGSAAIRWWPAMRRWAGWWRWAKGCRKR